jgi:hypothetical protein
VNHDVDIDDDNNHLSEEELLDDEEEETNVVANEAFYANYKRYQSTVEVVRLLNTALPVSVMIMESRIYVALRNSCIYEIQISGGVSNTKTELGLTYFQVQLDEDQSLVQLDQFDNDNIDFGILLPLVFMDDSLSRTTKYSCITKSYQQLMDIGVFSISLGLCQ